VEKLIGGMFTASLERAIAAGDAARIGTDALNLFWFAHHTVLTAALIRLPATPCLTYGHANDVERQLCEFLFRGIGLNEAAIASHLNRQSNSDSVQPSVAESA
jgi:TetR/AcrR family transcriptional regulator, transcriptional repressor of aconitase